MLSNEHKHPAEIAAGGKIEGQEIDPRGAVLLDGVTVAITELGTEDTQTPAFAFEMSGKINGEEEEARLLFIATPEGAAELAGRIVLSSTGAAPAAARRFADHFAALVPMEAPR